MVPAVSDRISRVPPYSGGPRLAPPLPVRAFHPLRTDFPDGSGSWVRRHLRPPTTPTAPRRRRFGLLPFRSPLLRESIFLSSPAGTKMFQFPALAPALRPVRGIRPRGLPHSDSHGSLPVCGSPWIFAAYRVLPRFRKPRHPPFALVLFLSRSRVTDPPASCDAKDPLSPVLREIAFPSAHARSLLAPDGAARLYLFFTSFSLSVLSMN